MADIESMPRTIMTFVVALLVLAIGIYAVLTITDTDALDRSYEGTFAVTNSSLNQTLSVSYKGMTGVTVIQHLDNDTSLTMVSNDWTYGGNHIVVNRTALFDVVRENSRLATYTNNVSLNTTQSMAQTFTVGSEEADTAFTIKYADLYLLRHGASHQRQTLYLNVTSVNATGFKFPVTTLASCWINGSNVTNVYPGGWYRFNFTTSNISLQPDTTYALNLSCTAGLAGGYVRWRNSSVATADYAGGKAIGYTGNWDNLTGDFGFSVFGENETNILNVTGNRYIPDLIDMTNQVFAVLGVILVISAIFLIVVLIRRQELM